MMKMVCVMTAGIAAQLHTSVIIHQIVYWKLVRFLVYKLHLDEVTEQGKKRSPGFRYQLCQAILLLRIYLRTESGPPGHQSLSSLARKPGWGQLCPGWAPHGAAPGAALISTQQARGGFGDCLHSSSPFRFPRH